MIETWLTTIITFLIGFYLGRTNGEVPENIKVAVRKVRRKVTGQKLGGINKLTPTQQAIADNPRLKAEEEAMEELLENVL